MKVKIGTNVPVLDPTPHQNQGAIERAGRDDNLLRLDHDLAGANARRGLSEDVVRNISALKNEPTATLFPLTVSNRTFSAWNPSMKIAPALAASVKNEAAGPCFVTV